MTKFEHASTGLAGLDRILDDLRLGDNVVWQVDSIDEYQYFVEPFVAQAVSEGMKVIYMRFGQHRELVKPDPRVKVYRLNANTGFESFSGQVHTIITREGQGVFYVFDSLSELLSAWATDLMIGNFFRVTCPYLFEQDTIAYFAVLRSRNSYETVARIRDTTQLLLDVFREGNRYYVHPLKVWGRYSPTMFLPHAGEGEDFVPVTSSVEAASLVARLNTLTGDSGRKLDYWDRLFMRARALQEKIEQGDPAAKSEEGGMIDLLCRMMISREEKVLKLAKKYFSLADLLAIRERQIGTGFIGGKTVGMLLARNILRDSGDMNWRYRLEPHDSFYIGSDVFYTHLVENDCWQLRMQQKEDAGYFPLARELKEKILSGKLPNAVREQFRNMLDYYGQAPIIVRSSSLLEDSFGNAFAGKYESVFCVNQGDPEDRYQAFEEAVKTVYASTMNEDALAYRLKRGMAKSDEQMALLVQRVSGSHRGHYFFPDLAGVGMSRNPYVWTGDMDPEAGMIRLVLGLGTRAVDRVDDYPRLVALDRPLLRPDATADGVRKYSQRKIDLLNTVKNNWDTVSINELSQIWREFGAWKYIAESDHETSRRMRQLGYEESSAWIITFERLFAETNFCALMKRMLNQLETAYEYPVDIEFTVNFCSGEGLRINLLQCRPLQTGRRTLTLSKSAQVDADKILFATTGSFMGEELLEPIKRIIYVEPLKYIELPNNDKYQVARIVGQLNRMLPERDGQPVMLIGPGRWGTSTPSLGVPVSFAEICNVAAMVEMALPKKGYMPELSFGTHFFQDLVEMGIIYVALFPGKKDMAYNSALLVGFKNIFTDLLPQEEKWQEVVKVYQPPDDSDLCLDLDLKTRRLICHLVPREIL